MSDDAIDQLRFWQINNGQSRSKKAEIQDRNLARRQRVGRLNLSIHAKSLRILLRRKRNRFREGNRTKGKYLVRIVESVLFALPVLVLCAVTHDLDVEIDDHL